MQPRPLPRPVPRGLRWVVPVGVGATVITGGMMSALASPALGPAPAPLPLTSVLFAALLAAQIGAVVLAPALPVGAAWLAVGAGLSLLPYDLPSWAAIGIGLGAVGAMLLHLRAAVVRQALATWPHHVTGGPHADAAGAFPRSPWRDLWVVGLVLAGAVLTVGGLVWTALDTRAVADFRAEAIEGAGRIIAVDEEGFSATIEIDGRTVIAPVNVGEPVVGSPVAVRWSPQTSRAEIVGDAFDPTGALVWTGLGILVLVAAWRRRRRVAVLVRAGSAPRLAAIALGARTHAERIDVVDTNGRTLGSLVGPQPLGRHWVTDLDAEQDDPAPWDELVGDDRDIHELTDAEVVARNRALAAVIAEASEDEVVDLRHVLPAVAAVDLVVLDDAPLDRPVLARVGDTWLTATLTGADPSAAERGTASPTAGTSSPVTAFGALDERPAPRGLRTRLRALTGRSDALLLVPVHLVAAAAVWWLFTDPPAGWLDVVRLAFPVGWLVVMSHGPRALVRVHPRYLESRGWVWDTWIPWREIERIGRAEGALVVRRRRTTEQDALILDRPTGASWTLVRFQPDDEIARRTIEQAWAAGQGAPRPLLPGRPSFSAVLGLGWLALLLTVLLR